MEQNTRYANGEELRSLEHRVTHLENRQTRSEARLDGIEKKLDKIDSNTTWALRLLVGAFVMALLGLVLRGGGLA